MKLKSIIIIVKVHLIPVDSKNIIFRILKTSANKSGSFFKKEKLLNQLFLFPIGFYWEVVGVYFYQEK